MSFEDYYSLLGVSPASSAVEIRKAYRRLVLQFHPDRNPGDKAAEEQFKRIVVAYETLSSTAKRTGYDAEFRSFREDAAQRKFEEERARRSQPQARPEPRPRKARHERPERPTTPYEAQSNELEGRDVLQGIAAGAFLCTLCGTLVLQKDASVGFATALFWALTSLVGAPIGYRFGSGFVRIFNFGYLADDFPALEVVAHIIPVVGALCGAWGLVRVAAFLGVPLLTLGLVPGALAAGLSGSLGSAFGRAFTSVGKHWVGKLVGILVGSFVGGMVGGALALFFLALVSHPFKGVSLYGTKSMMLSSIASSGDLLAASWQASSARSGSQRLLTRA